MRRPLVICAVVSAALAVAAGARLSAQDLRRGDSDLASPYSAPSSNSAVAGPKATNRVDPAREASRPLAPPDEAAGRKQILDALFERLEGASDEEEAKGVAGAIERVFLRSGSDTADLLMGRARSAMNSRDHAVATEILDKVVVIEPGWAEAWRQRATARFLAGDRIGAVADLGQALALEPRHFAALTGLGAILHSSGFDRRALEVFRRALEIYPHQSDIQELVDDIAPDVEGRDI